MNKIAMSAACLILLSGCAKKSADIQASYVPSMEYNSKSCRQLKNEIIEINREVRVITGVQDDKAKSDAVAVGVSIIFWPSLFFLASGNDNERLIADLKGRYKTIGMVAKKKKCQFAKDLK